MLTSIALDILLVLILLTMIPLGFLRGGLREVCTSAGLLLGILLASEWAGTWGRWISDRADVKEGSARFLVTIIIVVLVTGLVGYGSTAAFSYRPGPGGRMYGAYLAFFNGIIFAGYLINTVVADVFDGDVPGAIQDGFVSKALSVGFGWILLIGAFGILIATVFGMFVRERPADEFAYQGSAYAPQAASSAAPRPMQGENPHVTGQVSDPTGQTTAIHSEAPLRIREVRHWEDEPTPEPRRDYGGGWRQTWPDLKGQGPALPWEQQPAPKPPFPKRVSGSLRKSEQKPANPRDVLRDWMKNEDGEAGQ